MSDFKHKDFTGSLFKNEYKEKDTQPDYKGSATVGGKDFDAAGWISQTKSGTPYLSLKFGEPYNKDGNKTAPKQQSQAQTSDLPF